MAEVTEINEMGGTVLDDLNLDDYKPNLTTTTDEPNKPIEEPIVETTEEFKPEAYGGDRFDKAGNLIKDGKIIKTKNQVDDITVDLRTAKEKADAAKTVKPAEESTLELELDNDGNLVKDGKVVHKKGDFEINEEGEVTLKEVGFLKSLQDSYKEKGFSFEDADGIPIEFEDSDEGYNQFTDYISEQKTSSNLDEFFDSNPALKALALHLQAGKSELEFYESRVNQVDYNKVEVTADELDQEKLVLDLYKKIYQMPDDEAREAINLLKDAGKLKDKALTALESLKTWQTNKQEAELTSMQEAIKAEQLANQETIKNIEGIITKGNLGDINIPESKRKDFFNYLTKEVKPGATQATLDYNQLSLDKQLMIDYLVYSKLSIDELIRIKVNTAKADLIKNRSKSAKAIVIRSNNQYQKAGANIPDLDDIG